MFAVVGGMLCKSDKPSIIFIFIFINNRIIIHPDIGSDLTTALEELERITRKWGMMVNYPKTEAVVFAARRRRQDPSWIQQRGSQASVQV